MSAKESSGAHENLGERWAGDYSGGRAHFVRVRRKAQKNLAIDRRCTLEERRPEAHRHPALPVTMEGSAAEAMGRPVSKAVEGQDVLREQLAVEEDVEHEMHGRTAEVP